MSQQQASVPTVTPRFRLSNPQDQQRYQESLTTLMEQAPPGGLGPSREQRGWEQAVKIHELLSTMTDDQFSAIVEDQKQIRKAAAKSAGTTSGQRT